MAVVVCPCMSINFLRFGAYHIELGEVDSFMNPFIFLLDHMQAIGVKVQNGYGLTETSPVIAARRPGCNVRN